MDALLAHPVFCPYCGETFETVIDTSQGDSEYTEDCYVCCRPIVFVISQADSGHIRVETRREDE